MKTGITDKISGRLKKAAGDLLGDEQIRRQGAREERKGEAKDELAREQERAERVEAQAAAARAAARRRAEEIERLERRT